MPTRLALTGSMAGPDVPLQLQLVLPLFPTHPDP